jgi:two-component sensor histidine kinase
MGDKRDTLHFLDGGGRMGELMRTHDWSKSPLGDPAGWPDPLKMAVSTCLGTRFPMVVWWGHELIMLYNDAWQPILGETKHPTGMGRPGAESWPETWPIVGEQFESALRGVASWSEDLLLASDRHGYLEECYFTYSHSPLRDSQGHVLGVLSTVIETTNRVLSERRLHCLRDLSTLALKATGAPISRRETEQALIELLCSRNPDVPFGMLYSIQESGEALCSASSGIETNLLPRSVGPGENDPWGIGRVLGGEALAAMDRPQDSANTLPGGVWPEPARQHVAIALSTASRALLGVLVVGINSRLRLDGDYLDFLRLVAAQLTNALAAIRSVEGEAQAAKARELLVQELLHRSRNLLTVVQSISARTRKVSSSLEEYGAAFDGRIAALARAQGLLSQEGESISLPELVNIELDILTDTDRARVTVAGPLVFLPRAHAQMISMALHELTTNAVKYGALKDLNGALNLGWRLDPETRVIHIEWRERGLPKASKISSDRHGFGRTLLEQALPSQGARTRFDLSSDGLNCVIELPAAD